MMMMVGILLSLFSPLPVPVTLFPCSTGFQSTTTLFHSTFERMNTTQKVEYQIQNNNNFFFLLVDLGGFTLSSLGLVVDVVVVVLIIIIR